MIGFLWRRGNIEKEQKVLFSEIQVESELQDIDLYKLRSVFERVLKRPKKVKKKPGRPRKVKTNPLNF